MSMKANGNPDEREKLLIAQLARLEEEVKCNRCYNKMLKWGLDLLEQAGATISKLPSRRVRKNNTIMYKGRAYLLPPGTYLSDFPVEVPVKEEQGLLKIFHPLYAQVMALYPVDQEAPVCSTGPKDNLEMPLF